MKLFTKVHCKAYMKKINDGRYISLFDENGEPTVLAEKSVKAIGCNSNGETIKDLSEYCGESIEKIYRERVEKSFNGFLVGYTHIDVKGELGTDYFEDCYHSYNYIFKEVTDYPEVAVVYFRNNCKRYVLLDDIEDYEDYKPDSNKECPLTGQISFEDIGL